MIHTHVGIGGVSGIDGDSIVTDRIPRDRVVSSIIIYTGLARVEDVVDDLRVGGSVSLNAGLIVLQVVAAETVRASTEHVDPLDVGR